MFDFETSKIILLTGAGFTKNFGGFLSSEMWGRIFNQPNVQNSPNLKNLLVDNTDFESVYALVMAGDFSDSEKKILEDAILTAYRRLDDVVKNWFFNSSNPLAFNPYNNSGLGCLMELINKEPGKKGMFFTLNQDLVAERRWHHRSLGAHPFYGQFYQIDGSSFDSSHFLTLPDDQGLIQKVKEQIESTNGTIFIKLHGSYGWKSSTGKNQLVLGHNKEHDIEKEPLLQIYSDVFKETVLQHKKKMIVIGYGFGDEHINKVIVEGIRDFGLKIYILGSSPFAEFREKLRKKEPMILDGLIGYCDKSFQELFPPNQGSKTPYLEEILAAVSS